MELSLSNEEHAFLLNILEQAHRELFNEIAHTDHREFRTELRRNEETLDSLIHRLQVTVAQELPR